MSLTTASLIMCNVYATNATTHDNNNNLNNNSNQSLVSWWSNRSHDRRQRLNHLCTLAIFIFDSKQTDFVWSQAEVVIPETAVFNFSALVAKHQFKLIMEH